MMRVIILEDEPIVSDLYTRLLQPVSSRIQTARNLEELREELKVTPPSDVVILDLRLGQGTIHDTIHEIPKIKAVNPQAVVIVASGVSSPEVISEAMEKGADYFAVKPETNTLPGMVHAVLKGMEGKPLTGRAIELIEKLTHEIQCKNES
jgi:DNA-binding NtrC family response regulator